MLSYLLFLFLLILNILVNVAALFEEGGKYCCGPYSEGNELNTMNFPVTDDANSGEDPVIGDAKHSLRELTLQRIKRNEHMNATSLGPNIKSFTNYRMSSNDHFEAVIRLLKSFINYRQRRDLRLFACSNIDAVVLIKRLIPLGILVTGKSVITDNLKNISNLPPINFVDLSCNENLESYYKVVKGKNTWLIYDKLQHLDEQKIMNLRLDSDITLASGDGKLFDVYAIFTSIFKVPAGTWHPMNFSFPNWKTRFNLMGNTLRVGILNYLKPLMGKDEGATVLNPNYHPGVKALDRSSMLLNNYMATIFNFKIKYYFGETWGLLQKDGSFNGLVGLLIANEIDMTPCSMEMREERSWRVTFIPHFQSLRIIFIFMEERTLGTYKALLVPFSPAVWFCTVLIIILGGITFGYMYYDDMFQGLLLVVGIFAQQGLGREAKRGGSRTFSACLLLLGLLLYSYYNAAIMNGLLSPSPNTIRNIVELNKSSLRLAIANHPYINISYNQKRYIPHEVLNKIQKYPDWIVEAKYGLEKMKHERYSIVADDTALYTDLEGIFTESEKCNLREVESIRPCPMTFVLQKDSEYRDMFYFGALRIQETGISFRENNRWFPRKPDCLGATVFTHVGPKAITVAMILYLFGFAASCLTFIIELWTYKKKMKNKKILWNKFRK